MTRRRGPLRGVARLAMPQPARAPASWAAAGRANKPDQAPRPPRAAVVIVVAADGRLDLYCDDDAVDLHVVRLPALRETAAVEAMRDELIWLSVPPRHRGVLYPRHLRRAHILQCPPSVRALAEAEFTREIRGGLDRFAAAMKTPKEGTP